MDEMTVWCAPKEEKETAAGVEQDIKSPKVKNTAKIKVKSLYKRTGA